MVVNICKWEVLRVSIYITQSQRGVAFERLLNCEVDLSNVKTLSDPRIILQNNDIIYIAQNKRAVKNDQLQNVTTTLSPAFLILNSVLLIYTLIHR